MIGCNDYDYIEIVCMHKYPIELTMQDGSTIECTALDTALNKNREECIKVRFEGEDAYFVLDNIVRLEVSVENPHFQVVNFSE